LKLVNVKGSRPTRILIPSIDVNLPVYETDIVAGVWQIQHDGISHLMQSANPGIRGNIILYGHNSAERLRRLPELVDGQRIIITSEDGSDRMYLVQSTAVVRPNDMSVVAQTPEETLTLYTCYGLADSLRYVVTASPLEDSLAGF
jgi:LPXTG-site transpeptidase (sortase) family protein